MQLRSCPVCGAATPRLLDDVAKDGTVWYYRCHDCGHIWSIANRDEKQVSHITPFPPRPRDTT